MTVKIMLVNAEIDVKVTLFHLMFLALFLSDTWDSRGRRAARRTHQSAHCAPHRKGTSRMARPSKTRHQSNGATQPDRGTHTDPGRG